MRVYNSEQKLYALKSQLTINNISPSDKWLVADGTDFNNLKTIGTYYVKNNASMATMTNAPPTGHGGILTNSLPLENINIGVEISGAWKYILQEFTTFQGVTFRRYLEANGSGVWTYGVWNKILASNESFETGTIATETYGTLTYTYSPTQHIAQVRWAGNGTKPTTDIKLYTIPDKLKPRGGHSPFCVLHNGIFMEINSGGTLQLNIGTNLATWSAGFVSYITI